MKYLYNKKAFLVRSQEPIDSIEGIITDSENTFNGTELEIDSLPGIILRYQPGFTVDIGDRAILYSDAGFDKSKGLIYLDGIQLLTPEGEPRRRAILDNVHFEYKE